MRKAQKIERLGTTKTTLRPAFGGESAEHHSRLRDRTAARNLALLHKIALTIVGRDQTTKASVRAWRKKAAWNDSYMLELLIG